VRTSNTAFPANFGRVEPLYYLHSPITGAISCLYYVSFSSEFGCALYVCIC